MVPLLEPTTLVQRLKRPYTAWGVNYLQSHRTLDADPGVDLPLGGFTEEELREISQFFRIDAMHNPNYLDGRLADTFRQLDKTYVEGAFSIEEMPVYYMCKPGNVSGVVARIQELATNMTIPTHFSKALHPSIVHHTECVAWLEIDNQFFFCLDQGLFLRFTAHIRRRS